MATSRTIDPFLRARPVWLAGCSEEMNVGAGWRAVIAGGHFGSFSSRPSAFSKPRR